MNIYKGDQDEANSLPAFVEDSGFEFESDTQAVLMANGDKTPKQFSGSKHNMAGVSISSKASDISPLERAVSPKSGRVCEKRYLAKDYLEHDSNKPTYNYFGYFCDENTPVQYATSCHLVGPQLMKPASPPSKADAKYASKFSRPIYFKPSLTHHSRAYF